MSTNKPEPKRKPNAHDDSWFAPSLGAAALPRSPYGPSIDPFAGPSDGPSAGFLAGSPANAPAEETWDASRARSLLVTQVLHDDEDPEDKSRHDIGRLVGNDQRELFVSCGPVEAMLQQFDVLRPEFIALHDVGCAASRRLLGNVARASGQNIQKLIIRRQGYGTPLASLEFIEWPAPAAAGAAGARTIRLYSTDVDADAASRGALAQALLANSRLGVIFVGDQPAAALAGALQPLEYAIGDSGWLNRHLLLLPLGAGGALAQPAAALGGRSGLIVRTTPQISRPAEAWGYLSSTWNRVREQLGDAGRQLPGMASAAWAGKAPPGGEETPARGPVAPPPRGLADAAPSGPSPATPKAPFHDPPATEPAELTNARLPVHAAPEIERDAAAAGAHRPGIEDRLTAYLERLGRLNGVLACCVFDGATSAPLALFGADYDADLLSREGHVLFDAMSQAAESFGMVLGLPEMAITLEAHHLLLRPVPKHPELILLAVIDRQINLTLIRLQIQRVDDEVG